MSMGDREKRDKAAACNTFPLAPKAACLYHIRKNIETNHIRCNKGTGMFSEGDYSCYYTGEE
jgi:hypothetical protein